MAKSVSLTVPIERSVQEDNIGNNEGNSEYRVLNCTYWEASSGIILVAVKNLTLGQILKLRSRNSVFETVPIKKASPIKNAMKAEWWMVECWMVEEW